jgi:pyruvate,water dikinase
MGVLGFIKRRLAEAQEEENRAFRQKYSNFRELLERNNEVLETISLLSEIRDQGRWINLGRLRALMTHTAVNVYRLIQNLNHITEGRYRVLEEKFNFLQDRITQALDVSFEFHLERLSIPLEEVGLELAAEVGPKAARLGEIARRLGAKVPPGVAFTTYAYHRFLEHNHLGDEINKESLLFDPDHPQAIEQVSARLQEMIMDAELPPELEEELEAAWRRLQEGTSSPVPVVMRSSAVGEDEAGSSFAGLYHTVINPAPHELGRAYKEVVASKFSSRALTYLWQKGFYHELCPMCVTMMRLVDARSGGVMFTRDGREQEAVSITGVWGLGKLAVDGSVSPDIYRLSREDPPRLLERRLGDKAQRLVLREGGGIAREPVPPEEAARPCLENGHLRRLAKLGLALERVFGGPQDVEWVVERGGEVFLVQSRPLKLEPALRSWQEVYPWEEMEQGPDPLVQDLQVASAGAACGPVVMLRRLAEAGEVAEGAVVLVGDTSPELVRVLPRAGAVVAEKGNTSGHLSIIAREFGVPLLIGLSPQGAERLLQEELVTVDAYTGAVFPGRVEALLRVAAELRHSQQEAGPTPVQRILSEVLQYVTPLHLIDPRDPSFRPQSIQSFHDIIRFAHEQAINAMFEINDSRITRRGRVVRLRSEVPLDIYLIDLGGGLAPGAAERKVVGPEDITSIPMRALYRGMTTPGVRWAGHIPIDFKGFMSVFANTMFDAAKPERRLGDRSYAIVSRHYVNFSSRLGYHFSIVDAYLGRVPNENYISFRFKGGAAGIDKRTRRVRFLQEVLEHYGFWVDQKADLVNARIKRLGQAELEEKLEMLGRLMGCSRQLDVTMHSDAVVARYVELFLKGDYSMGHGEASEGGTA